MATDIVPYSEQEIPRFNPAEHIMPIKNKQGKTDYLPVQWRLVWANEQCLELDIRTKSVEIDLEREMEVETYAWNNDTRRSEKIVKRAKGFAKVEVEVTAVLKDGRKRHAEGVKTESAVNFADFVEKAQTGALGRALAMIGFGTQFVGDEFDERERIVDAPVESHQQAQRKSAAPSEQEKKAYEQRKPFVEGTVVKEETSQNAPATEQQLASIRKLCQHLGNPDPDNQETMTYLNAKELIAQLSLEYRQSRQTKQPEQPAAPAQEEETEEKYDRSLSKAGMSTDQQQASIVKFCQRLGRTLPPNLKNMTFDNAVEYINVLNADMKAARTKSA